MQLVYETLPEGFSPKVEVVACFCLLDDKILFLKRNKDKPQGETWGVPAGKLEQDEQLQCAIIREVFEETCIVIQEKEIEFLKTVYVRYPENDFVYHMFRYKLFDYPSEMKISKREHQEAKWVTPQQALKMELIPGENECIHMIFNV